MNQNQHKIIKQKIFEKIGYSGDNACPFYFITLQYGFYNDKGNLIDISQTRKYWDKTEVQKTVRLVRNLLKENLSITGFYAFLERHKGHTDQYGDTIKQGRFHNHIITTSIEDSVIQKPNRKTRRLLSSVGWTDKSFNGLSIDALNQCKIRLLENCIQRAEWVNRYSHSIKTEIISTRADLKTVVEYCLKEYNLTTGLDFTDIVDFDNSDFYIP